MFELMFRLIMNGIMVHIAPGTVSQILTGMVICGIGYSVLQYSRPYRVDYNNSLAIVCKFQLLLTLFSALLVKLRVPFFSQVKQACCRIPRSSTSHAGPPLRMWNLWRLNWTL